VKKLKILSKPKVKHPWDRWFKRRKFKLYRYKDFLCQPPIMAQQVRNAASSREVGVSVDVEGGTVLVTVWGRKDAKSTNEN
jgi:hypothetical protein